MSLSSSLIYKWCEAKDGPERAGADNPLDRTAKIYDLTGDVGPVKWLCRKANGFFVANPEPATAQGFLPLLGMTQRLLKEFSELLTTVSESVSDDGKVDDVEADRIRKEWEDLKSVGESFVSGCEQGIYGKQAWAAETADLA